ncbi:GntR family transcriptional regulator [uncultured Clostridium sp.]|uniref:GntR family transcriptional regulator n=1 Tax=uncultured Clostridium sp. TaxID=59620 RepID=UPI00262327D7|nr:GntR family transcriptional regulator [uncultured Clostridium sp.]
MIDKNSPIPAYYQLKEEIRDKIAKGVWKTNECIASERELVEQYEVSRMTVRQALGELVQEGLLVREKGKGTFVCEPKVKQKDVMSFTDIIRKSGRELKTQILEFEMIAIPEELSDTLNVEKVYKINRMRKVDNECIANEIVHIPVDKISNLEKDMLKGSLFEVLEAKGYMIDHSESEITAIVMDEYYKNLFDVNEVIPLIKTYGKTLDSNGNILFIEESVYRSDKYILEVNISRREGILK